METGHPNDLDLELSRTGEVAVKISAHVETCPTCQQRLELLERFARELAPERVEIPAELDDAILAVAAGRPSSRRRRWLWAVPAAAAAAALLLFWPASHQGQLAAAPDLNADGRVDIVDAMLLARAMPNEQRPDWDANGDARVDDKDVEFLAMAAVSLRGGNR